MKKNMFCVSKKLLVFISIFLLTILLFFAVNSLNKSKITKNSEASIFNCLGAGYKKAEKIYVYKNQNCCGNKTAGNICFEPAYNLSLLGINNYGLLNCNTEELTLQKGSCFKSYKPKKTPKKIPTSTPKVISDTGAINIVKCDLSENNNNRQPKFWIKECCSGKDISTGTNKCVFSTYDVVKDNNISSDAYLAQYVLDCKKNEYYECGGRASCTVDPNNLNKLKCDPQAGPYLIPTPEPKVSVKFIVFDQNNYSLNIQDGEKLFTIRIDINPNPESCDAITPFNEIKEKGFTLNYSAIVPEYTNGNFFIKVIDTAFLDLTYTEKAKEILKEKLPYSELWSIEGVPLVGVYSNDSFDYGKTCIKK